MATNRIVRTVSTAGFAVSAGFLIAVTGAATASADGYNGLTTQTGGSVDPDGTNGTSRGVTNVSTSSHSIRSDACAVKGSSYPYSGCQYPDSFDPRTIAEKPGVSDQPGSALDADGEQATAIRGPVMVSTPQTTAH